MKAVMAISSVPAWDKNGTFDRGSLAMDRWWLMVIGHGGPKNEGNESFFTLNPGTASQIRVKSCPDYYLRVPLQGRTVPGQF
jgi:hypothetical protein